MPFPWSNFGKLFFHSTYIYVDGKSEEKPLPTFFSWRPRFLSKDHLTIVESHPAWLGQVIIVGQ